MTTVVYHYLGGKWGANLKRFISPTHARNWGRYMMRKFDNFVLDDIYDK